MDTQQPTMQDLFCQLGLPDSPQDIRAFVHRHRPLPLQVLLKDAPFWTTAQSQLIHQKLTDDSDWALVIDTLNAQLREHPAPDDMPQGNTAQP